jgi:hypothetical protein
MAMQQHHSTHLTNLNCFIQVVSVNHTLAAVFRAINDMQQNRLKSRNVHSEIVFSLSPNNNVSFSYLVYHRQLILNHVILNPLMRSFGWPRLYTLGQSALPLTGQIYIGRRRKDLPSNPDYCLFLWILANIGFALGAHFYVQNITQSLSYSLIQQ